MEGGDRDHRERVERLRERVRRRWDRDDSDVDALAAELDSDDPRERAGAAWALAELASEDADWSRRLPVESELVPLLDDDDRWVRRGASWAVATVADEHPHRARDAVPAVTEALADADPLVRENSVLALSGVGAEYPRTVEPALTRLAVLVREGEGLTRRYAAETLRRLVTRLDEDGFPQTVAATPEFADLLPGDADVVEVTDDSGDGGPIEVRGGSGGRVEDGEKTEDGEDDEGSGGPPEQVPSPPDVAADRGEFDRLADLGGDPLTTAVKARVPAAGERDRPVAVTLRTLRPDVSADPDRVERAIRAWAGVDDHDHVAPILGRGSSPRPWFATQLFDGGTLRDHLGSVGFDRAVWYAHCLVKAICHGHARGVVHGALRPSAVGLSRSLGAWPVPKVGDWGLGDSLAAVRSPPVPPAYAAPEHVDPRRFGRLDSATDVYQLGAVCYALFAGRPPFAGDAAEVARKVRTEDPPPASEFAPELPSGVDDLLDRALTKEKPARFETAGDFRRQLELLGRNRSLPFEL